jgi:hypothetical protein
MKNFQHKAHASGKWRELTLIEQMANIGSEVFRANKWRDKSPDIAQAAFERSLELFYLTIEDSKNKHRLKEVLLAKEVWIDYFAGDNNYKSSAESLNKYFYEFNYAARLKT